MANGEEEERTYAVKGDGHGGISARPTNGADTRAALNTARRPTSDNVQPTS